MKTQFSIQFGHIVTAFKCCSSANTGPELNSSATNNQNKNSNTSKNVLHPFLHKYNFTLKSFKLHIVPLYDIKTKPIIDIRALLPSENAANNVGCGRGWARQGQEVVSGV